MWIPIRFLLNHATYVIPYWINIFRAWGGGWCKLGITWSWKFYTIHYWTELAVLEGAKSYWKKVGILACYRCNTEILHSGINNGDDSGTLKKEICFISPGFLRCSRPLIIISDSGNFLCTIVGTCSRILHSYLFAFFFWPMTKFFFLWGKQRNFYLLFMFQIVKEVFNSSQMVFLGSLWREHSSLHYIRLIKYVFMNRTLKGCLSNLKRGC